MNVQRHTDPPIGFDGRTTLAEWADSLPTFEGRRPMLTADGYLNLLRHMLAGGEVPFYELPGALLTDAILAVNLRISDAERSCEIAQLEAARDRPTVKRLWALVYTTGKRKTMRTEDVRAALEAGRG